MLPTQLVVVDFHERHPQLVIANLDADISKCHSRACPGALCRDVADRLGVMLLRRLLGKCPARKIVRAALLPSTAVDDVVGRSHVGAVRRVTNLPRNSGTTALLAVGGKFGVNERSSVLRDVLTVGRRICVGLPIRAGAQVPPSSRSLDLMPCGFGLSRGNVGRSLFYDAEKRFFIPREVGMGVACLVGLTLPTPGERVLQVVHAVARAPPPNGGGDGALADHVDRRFFLAGRDWLLLGFGFRVVSHKVLLENKLMGRLSHTGGGSQMFVGAGEGRWI